MWMKAVSHMVHCIHPTIFYYPLDSRWLPSQNLSRIKMKLIFSPLFFRGSTIKVFTVGTTIYVHHPDSLCLLFQATAPPDRPPAPTSHLIQTTSLWFPATNRSLRLNLSAFCPPPPSPSSFSSFTRESSLWFGLGIKRVQMDEYVLKQKWS